MASETSELTFVRCPSCRSLVPATATRCRICNNPLEGTDGAAKASDSEAAKAASRVRQKTITATPEDVASALKQAKPSATPAAAAQPPGPGPVPAPDESSEEGDFDPLSAYLEELEDEPKVGPKDAAGDAPYTIEATDPVSEPDDDFGFDIFDDLEPEVEQKGAAVAPESDDLDLAPKAPGPRQSIPKEVPLKPAPAARESAPPAAPAARTEEPRREDGRREPPRPPPVQPQAKREQQQQSASGGRGDNVAVQQPHRVQNQDRQQERRPREATQQQRDVAQQPRRESREQAQPQSQSPQRHQQQQPTKPPPQPQQRGGERHPEARRSEERRPQEETRHEERRHDDRRGDDRRGDDRRRDERRPQATPPPAPVVAEQVASAGPKTGKMRPGRLFGWFVSYENPDGRAIELREGKFFVTGSSIRPTDLILEDPSISTPHALMAVSAEGGLVIQDLMSDRGVFVRSNNGGGYRREEGTAHVGHGDWIRFGDVEFLVIVVPQGVTR